MINNHSIMEVWVHVLTFFLLHQTCCSLSNYSTEYPWCRQLLQVKNQLFPHGTTEINSFCRVASWNQSLDCCRWDGVSCDASRRQVIGLDLSSCCLTCIPSNTTLFTLTHLQNLSLADNKFHYSQIPSEIGRLYRLTHLDLSSCSFSGKIPLELYHLSNLESLDLSANSGLTGDIQTLVGNMSKIREIFLSSVNLNTSEIPTNMSSFLTHLDLYGTGVRGSLPASIFEKPNLKILNLEGNYDLTGSLPTLNSSSVGSLEELRLSSTSISGTLPDSIGFMANLTYLGLSNCSFWGPIPDSIGNMTQLIEINLSENIFSGRFPSPISNLWHLSSLDLSRNALHGPFHSRAQHRLEKLSYMDLSHNYIQGMIPSWLPTLPSLYHLDLSFNRLTGQIGVFNSQNLVFLDLSNNQLFIELDIVFNLPRVEDLRLSSNSISKHVSQTVNATTLNNLQALDLSSCEIEEFPEFLKNSSSLYSLELSNNKIHGLTPTWFSSSLLPRLRFLNLSTNHLTSAEYLPWQLDYLNLESNSLQGTFPLSVCDMSLLSYLILSNNKLDGQIPECIGSVSTGLYVLDLRRNQLIGKIPETIGNVSNLEALQLNGNGLEGPLPQSLAKCTSLRVLDLGNNIINDTFPLWLQALPMLEILILKSNRFHGSISPTFSNDSFNQLQIIDLSYNCFSGFLPDKLFSRLKAMDQVDDNPYAYMGLLLHTYSVTLYVKGRDVEYIKVFHVFTTIDLSNNNFQGSIPESLAYLYSLRLLNLSHNNINGHIPPELGNLKELEQLDLSSNQLTGGIPQSLRNLTFLVDLDVSHNHLVGLIPQGNQFSTFTNESYAGNSGLCGAPLTRSCGDDGAPPSPAEMEQEEDDSGIMMGFTWQSVVIGYGSGIVVGFIMGSVMIALRKPIGLARFVYAEAASCLRRRRRNRNRR